MRTNYRGGTIVATTFAVVIPQRAISSWLKGNVCQSVVFSLGARRLLVHTTTGEFLHAKLLAPHILLESAHSSSALPYMCRHVFSLYTVTPNWSSDDYDRQLSTRARHPGKRGWRSVWLQKASFSSELGTSQGDSSGLGALGA